MHSNPQGPVPRVLLVDDDRTLLAMAEDMLAGLGYEPVGYDSSVKALAAFSTWPERFDAVLSDEVMPELTGTQLVLTGQATQGGNLRPISRVRRKYISARPRKR
jgi:CheY-like chemotaxis protein